MAHMTALLNSAGCSEVHFWNFSHGEAYRVVEIECKEDLALHWRRHSRQGQRAVQCNSVFTLLSSGAF